MAPGIGERHPESHLAQRRTKWPHLTVIREQVMKDNDWRSRILAARFEAETLVATGGEPGHPHAPGRTRALPSIR